MWQRQYEPRPLPYPGPDGGLIVATERELTFYDAAGKLLRTEPNGAPAHQLVGGPLNLRPLANAYLEADNEAFGNRGWRPAVTKSVDDAILDSYLNFKSVRLTLE